MSPASNWARDYVTNSYFNGEPSVAIAISQRPGSNALETASSPQEPLAELATRFPEGLEYNIGYNPTEFIAESVRAVEHTVFEAVILVIIVIVLFLRELAGGDYSAGRNSSFADRNIRRNGRIRVLAE